MSEGVKLLERQTDLVFDKRQTNIAKGVALLLLLYHHLFFYSMENMSAFYSIFRFANNVPIECEISTICKVCVSIFLILSGYGISKSWEKRFNYCNKKIRLKNQIKFVKDHYIKLMSNYWFIYLLFVPLGFLFYKSPIEVYNNNIIYFFVDIFGLSSLFNTPTMNETWWFMTPIIVFYVFYPIFVKVIKYSPELFVAVSAIPLFLSFLHLNNGIFNWMLPFAIGMCISERDCFSRIKEYLNTFPKVFIVLACCFIIFAYLRYIDYGNTRFDSFLGLCIILFCFFVLSKIPIINKVLEQLGKHSGAIFMFHTFIFDLYFRKFIYWFKFSPLIFIVMTVVCYIIAVGLDWLKKLVRYDKLIIRFTS